MASPPGNELAVSLRLKRALFAEDGDAGESPHAAETPARATNRMAV